MKPLREKRMMVDLIPLKYLKAPVNYLQLQYRNIRSGLVNLSDH